MKIDIDQIGFINRLLRSIVLDMEHHFGFEFTITSLYRIEGTGVHSTLPLRGIDIRCHDFDIGMIIEKYVNSKYQYDAKRPNKKVCLYHDSGSGRHLHFQVHPNTIIINQ